MKFVAAAAMLLVAGTLAAQQPAPKEPSADELFQRALGYHDTGRYDDAIAIYKQLLAKTPDNENVKYDLTFSTFAKGDLVEAIRLATEGAAKPGKNQVRYYEILGNAYDAQHRTREAIDAFRRGIKIEPKYARIHYNLGVAYTRENKLRDARQELERAIELDFNYPSPHFAIGDVYRLDGYRIPAILAYGLALSMEPAGPRATLAAQRIQTLLNLGVEEKAGGNLNITIDPNSKKDLGDFSGLEMMAAIAAGASHVSEKEKLTEFDRQADTLASFLAMFSESSGDLKRGFVADTYVPFYNALVKADGASTFAHVALAPLKLAGTEEWMAAHKSEVAAFVHHD
ncbi:MAG TPA: tetratricopeptide repeat protein [Thermoanaerobaculia bacterium]